MIFGLQTTPLCHHILIGDGSKVDQYLVQTNNGINNHLYPGIGKQLVLFKVSANGVLYYNKKIMTYLFE